MVENKLHEALIERIQNAPQDPSIVDLSLSSGFASLMVWADFFVLSRREREFLFYLRDQIETFERDSLVIEPVPPAGSEAPPADSTQPGAAPEPDPDGPIEDAVFPTTEQIANQRKTNNWDVAPHERAMYGPIKERLPDEEIVEKIRAHLRDPEEFDDFVVGAEPSDANLFPLPNDPPPARKKPGREYKKKEEPVLQTAEPTHTCSRCEVKFESAALFRNHERKNHGREDLPCIHSWLLGAPIGPIVTGTCKFCSAVKDFPSDREAVPLSLQQGRRSGR